jgi:hypothetical protein
VSPAANSITAAPDERSCQGRTAHTGSPLICISAYPLNRWRFPLPLLCRNFALRYLKAFKRLKSLLQMGQVPKKKEASCRAWMQGKILTALLIERLLCEARFFSPWGYPL